MNPTTPIHVLVAEDSQLNMLVIERYLTPPRFKLFLAEDGQEALDLYIKCQNQGQHIDIALLDFEMPFLSGDQVAEGIRAYEKEHGLKAIPIVAVTALSDPATVSKCESAGMNFHLVKPMAKELLLEAMLHAMAEINR